MAPDPEKRLTAPELLIHPWIVGTDVPTQLLYNPNPNPNPDPNPNPNPDAYPSPNPYPTLILNPTLT